MGDELGSSAGSSATRLRLVHAPARALLRAGLGLVDIRLGRRRGPGLNAGSGAAGARLARSRREVGERLCRLGDRLRAARQPARAGTDGPGNSDGSASTAVAVPVLREARAQREARLARVERLVAFVLGRLAPLSSSNQRRSSASRPRRRRSHVRASGASTSAPTPTASPPITHSASRHRASSSVGVALRVVDAGGAVRRSDSAILPADHNAFC